MKELSLNILDVTKNSVTAGADTITIALDLATDGWLEFKLTDNGCGMSEEVCRRVTDPFYTTRTTRKVGMGLPLLKLAAEQTGGEMTITSSTEIGNSGTVLRATFDTKSIDFMPVGDIVSTVCVLISGDPDIRFIFKDTDPRGEVALDTSELRAVLGDEISLAEPEVVGWIRGYLKEQYEERENKNNI
ncbi:MAG: sensor histidine kinase [Clostridia bacterium]|nr:sensor histidine kinase [Clostridia bacterium]MBO7249906.1 sensor histidine kinase [Clostridia bacterium]